MSHTKRWVIAGIVLLGIIAGLSVIFIVLPLTQKSSTTTPKQVGVTPLQPMEVCSKTIIQQASVPLRDSDQVALGEVVEKITPLKDFDRDPNCLYITLQYAIASGDGTTSRDYLSKLERVYTQAVGFSDAFTVSLTPLATLRKNVDFIAQNTKGDTAQQDQSTIEGSNAADKFQQEQKQ